MRLIIIPISPSIWGSTSQTGKEFQQAVAECKDCIRKISKKMHLSIERKRLSRACDVIERIALAQYGSDYLELSGDDAALLIESLTTEHDICLPILDRIEDKEILSLLPESKSIEVQSASGFVLLHDPCFDEQQKPKSTTVVNPARAALMDIEHEFSEDDVRKLKTSELRAAHIRVRKALASNICLGHMRHEFLINTLREYLYIKEKPTKVESYLEKEIVPDKEAIRKQQLKWYYKILRFFGAFKTPTMTIDVEKTRVIELSIEPAYLRLGFRDGSEARPFPLYSLLLQPKPVNLTSVAIGLISGRHLELDGIVDLYLFRNAEIWNLDSRSHAEQEEYAFDKTTRFLEELIGSMGNVEVNLFHTGLETVLLGFYRATVEFLRVNDNRGKLILIPRFRKNTRYIKAKPWY